MYEYGEWEGFGGTSSKSDVDVNKLRHTVGLEDGDLDARLKVRLNLLLKNEGRIVDRQDILEVGRTGLWDDKTSEAFDNFLRRVRKALSLPRDASVEDILVKLEEEGIK